MFTPMYENEMRKQNEIILRLEELGRESQNLNETLDMAQKQLDYLAQVINAKKKEIQQAERAYKSIWPKKWFIIPVGVLSFAIGMTIRLKYMNT